MPQYRALVDEALRYAEQGSARAGSPARNGFMDKLAVNFGCEILKIIPGRVSTEVDAGFSFDTEATIAKARSLIDLYRQAGVDRERILIKVGSTWEGIRAAEQPGTRRHPLQHDPALQLRPGGGLCRGGRHADLALRRAHLRLLPEGAWA